MKLWPPIRRYPRFHRCWRCHHWFPREALAKRAVYHLEAYRIGATYRQVCAVCDRAMAELIPDLIAKMETNLQARLRKRFHAWLLHAPVSAPDMDDQVSTVSETMSIDEATELCTRVFVAGSAEDKFSFKPVHGPPPTGYTDVLSRSERDDDPNGSVSYFSGSVYQTVDHNIFFDWLWEETIDLG